MPALTTPGFPFPALRHRNFRLFIGGQFVSLCGTWMQTVARGWLVLQLTDSAFQVGLVSAFGSVPILLFTLYGGVLADRVNKVRAITMLQGLMLFEALSLALLTQFHLITVHWVMGLALFIGTLSAFEVPIRQAFIIEMVGREDLMNAIALNSSVFNVTRIIGPSIAGILIATAGIAACFFGNALSYLAVLGGLLMMRFPQGTSGPSRPAGEGSFAEGRRYVFTEPLPRALLILTAVFSIFGFSFVTMLPVYARNVLHTGAAGYGGLMSSVGIGASIGAITMAWLGGRVRGTAIVRWGGVVFGIALILTALAHSYLVALGLLGLAGCAMIFNNIMTNTLLQTRTPDHLRGRVMSYYSLMVLGMAPFGSLQAGWVAEHFGVGASLAVGGVVCILLTLIVVGSGLPDPRPDELPASEGLEPMQPIEAAGPIEPLEP
ncbi:MAG: MFS transporter [Gemmatimonadota bacterium]